MKIFVVFTLVLAVSARPDLPKEQFEDVVADSQNSIKGKNEELLDIALEGPNKELKGYSSALSKKWEESNTTLCSEDLQDSVQIFNDWGSGVLAECSSVADESVQSIVKHMWELVETIGFYMDADLDKVRDCISQVKESGDDSCMSGMISDVVDIASGAVKFILEEQYYSVLLGLNGGSEIIKCVHSSVYEISTTYADLDYRLNRCVAAAAALSS